MTYVIIPRKILEDLKIERINNMLGPGIDKERALKLHDELDELLDEIKIDNDTKGKEEKI